ncbi:MAG: response regulator [bacterium]
MGKAHLLVVEDEMEMRLMLTAVLRDAGYRVSEAADGNAAMRILHDDPPDLVVLDLLIPGISGFEVCAAVRRSADRDVPVLVVTAHGSPENRRTAYACGANEIVAKPFTNPSLLAAVARLLSPDAEAGEKKEP